MRVCRHCSEAFPDEAQFCPFDGRPLSRAAPRGADPYLGRTLAARYRLIERVGVGGMAVVYLARHVLIERLSAIKILRQDLSLNPVHRERFLREARAVNRINHPNIVAITDFGEADGLVYLVMEYVAGESLAVPLRRGAIAWPRATRIALQIASALGRAHQMGVIHRDLKPDNVLLVGPPDGKATRDEDDRVKLTDFGIAKLVDAPALTVSDQLFGTPGYIPPEYLAGAECDGRADVYSLGVMLYEMLSARLPYEADTPTELLVAPLARPPIPLASRIARLPPALEALVGRMLARDPAGRPRDAFEVYDTLTEVLKAPAPPSSVVSVRAPGSDPDAIGYDTGPTMMDVPRSGVSISSSREGARGVPDSEGSAVRASGMVLRWQAAVTELEEAIVAARAGEGRGARADRASELADMARGMLAHIRRVAAMVVEHQGSVDRLEAQGRAFRASLGNAIDQLSLDRARARARVLALQGGRGAAPGARPHPAGVEERQAAAHEEDLAFQITTLQARLHQENERFERELWEAAGALEGALAALRHVHGELAKVLREATLLLATPA